MAMRTLNAKRTFTAVVHRCPESRVYLAFVPGFPGAYSHADSLVELFSNLRAVILLLLENGRDTQRPEFVGVQRVCVG
jgi:predicted RNase H-like HicB family nuclease